MKGLNDVIREDYGDRLRFDLSQAPLWAEEATSRTTRLRNRAWALTEPVRFWFIRRLGGYTDGPW